MKNLLILIMITAASYYYIFGKKSTCNNINDVNEKLREITSMAQNAINDGNLDRIMSFQKNVNRIKKIEDAVNADGSTDFQAVCNSLDDLVDGL